MPVSAPYQLWVDCPPPVSAVRSSNVLTVTLNSAHSLIVGSVVQIADTANLSGVNGVYTVASVPTSTSFTVACSGSNGSSKVEDNDDNVADGYAVVSQDLLNPLINYGSASPREYALYVPTESLTVSTTADGSGATMSFDVEQDDTPSVGAWFRLLPDDARIRLVQLPTGTEPTNAATILTGVISSTKSRLNGSGLGTSTSVSVADNNSLLDKVIVIGRARQPSYAYRLTRIGNVVTAKFYRSTLLGVGDQFTVSNAIGGGTTSFNGTFTVSTVASNGEFTYAQTGPDRQLSANAITQITPDNVKRKGSGGTTNKTLVMTFAASNIHGCVSGQKIEIQGFTGGNQNDRNYINSTFEGTNVKAVSSTVLEVNVGTAISFATTLTTGTGSLVTYSGALITPIATQVPSVGIDGRQTEDAAVQRILSYARVPSASDFALRRLLDLSTSSGIVGGEVPNSTGITFPSGSLRSALDSLIENFSGQDRKVRRYWVSPDGIINYRLVDPTAVPTYATAPYKIITSGNQDPDTSSAAATLFVKQIEVNWDQNTTKSAYVSASASTGAVISPKRISYDSVGLASRAGSPVFEEMLEGPTVSEATQLSAIVDKVATAFLLERHKPILSGSFVVSGSGTQSWNQYGYTNGGYGLNSSGVPTLVQGWRPSQWVSIECQELGLTGLYRIEQVDWGLEAGSYTSYVSVTFNRRPPDLLTTILSGRQR